MPDDLILTPEDAELLVREAGDTGQIPEYWTAEDLVRKAALWQRIEAHAKLIQPVRNVVDIGKHLKSVAPLTKQERLEASLLNIEEAEEITRQMIDLNHTELETYEKLKAVLLQQRDAGQK